MVPRSASRWTWTSLVALVGAGLVACGGGEQAEKGAEEAEKAEARQGPAVPADSQATVQGVVNFEGTPPEPEPVSMSEEEFCAAHYAPDGARTRHVLVQDGKLQNVFVHVTSDLAREFPTPQEAKELDQQYCRYRPHVMGVQTGQTLAILNSDSLLHNINAKPSQNRGFNISQPAAGMRTTRSFALEEIMVPVECDVHGWMNAYVGVVPHPYYDVSSADGSFTLDGLPPGQHMIRAWHEEYGTMTDTVQVAAGETAQVSFTYSADMAGAEVPLGEPIHPHAHADREAAAGGEER